MFSILRNSAMACARQQVARTYLFRSAPTVFPTTAITTTTTSSPMSTLALGRWSVVPSWTSVIPAQIRDASVRLISTLKRRRKMMNKHKLRKRRKKNRMSSKKR